MENTEYYINDNHAGQNPAVGLANEAAIKSVKGSQRGNGFSASEVQISSKEADNGKGKYRSCSLLEKMSIARDELENSINTKSGKNPSKGFSYIQLEDFMPQIKKICRKMGLCTQFTNEDHYAILRIYNVDHDEPPMEFKMELVTDFNIPGANGMQIMGAAQTYARRYLFINAFEICVPEEFDKIQGTYDPKTGMPYVSSVTSSKVSNNSQNVQPIYSENRQVPNQKPLTDEQYNFIYDAIVTLLGDKTGTYKSAAQECCHSYNVFGTSSIKNLGFDDAKKLSDVLASILDEYKDSMGKSNSAKPSKAAAADRNVSKQKDMVDKPTSKGTSQSAQGGWQSHGSYSSAEEK